MRTIAACLLLGGMLAGCGDGSTRDVTWRVEFDPATLRGRAARASLAIVEGGCDGTEQRYAADVALDEAAPAPDVLRPGTYGMRAEARDASCVVFAAVCEEVTFPPEGDEIVLTLAAVSERTACEGICGGGVCREGDAGPPDAGSPDAGPPEIVPSNVGAAVGLDESSAEVTVGPDMGTTWVLDTDDGSIEARNGATAVTVRMPGEGIDDATGIAFHLLPAPAGGAALGVFVVGSLTVPAGLGLEGVGSGALVILAEGPVQIDGTIDASAARAGPGPGGSAGAPGTPAGDPGVSAAGAGGGGAGQTVDGSNDDSGGGGGGFGSAGGAGGLSAVSPGGAAGAAHGDATLVPIRGGAGGGSGAGPSSQGGHGGGAIQISSDTSITVGATGIVDASGSGGGGGPRVAVATGGGGSGGGSGGAILLEAPVVSIAGPVGANGGGGGRAGLSGTSPADGADGSATTVPAPGAPSMDIAGGGGDGSDAAGTAEPGGSMREGGGGGGGAGRIRINTASGTEIYDTLVPTQASGLATVGTVHVR